MATVTGMTAERMQQIVDASVEGAAIEGSVLVFLRHDGSSFSAGNFDTFIATAVNSQVSSVVPATVVGGVTAKGNVSGTFSFSGITASQLVNRLFTATLTGNLTVNTSSFPSSPLPGTQFAIVMQQDANGSRLLTLTGIKRSQGVLTLSTSPNAVDIVSFMYDGSNWYAGLMGLGFS